MLLSVKGVGQTFSLDPSSNAYPAVNCDQTIFILTNNTGNKIWYRIYLSSDDANWTDVSLLGNAQPLNASATFQISGQSDGYYKIYYSTNNTVNLSSSSLASIRTTVKVSPTITSEVSNLANATCLNIAPNNLSVTASAGSGTISQYAWYSNSLNSNVGGTPTITNVTSSTTDNYIPGYFVTGELYYYPVVFNSYGCSTVGSQSGKITVNALPSAPTAVPTTVCYDGSAHTASATPGTGEAVVWYTASTGGTTTTQPSATAVGTITAYALAKNNTTSCESATRTSVALIINSLPAVATAVPTTVCYDGAVHTANATIGAGETLTWYTASTGGTATTQPSATAAGTITAYALAQNNTTACGSPIRTSVSLIINALPPTPTITSNSPVCEGAALTLNTANISGAIYYWEGVNGFTSSSVNPTINNATSAIGGSYSLKIKFNGCLSSLSTPLVVAVNPIPAAPTISSNSPIEEDKTLILTALNVTGASYLWSGPNGYSSNIQNPAIIASFANAGSYYAALTLNGCTSANSSPIVVVVTPKSSPVFQIPNAFTPNSDGHNDTFKIVQNGYVTSIISFRVFTKSGKLIFNDKDGAWDGRYAGIMLDADVYIWIADFINKNNGTEHLSGTVLLLK